ncbi:flavin reductase family protein [Cobetia sp. BMC6]|uniref:flavin reductase family protein n=1 Tax=Cobetia sp. BMC6 TaxID=2920521 RepID=UPI0032B77530
MSPTSSPCVAQTNDKASTGSSPPLGNPIINDSLHWLDCTIHAEHPAGDHLIVIGEVMELNLDVAGAARP